MLSENFLSAILARSTRRRGRDSSPRDQNRRRLAIEPLENRRLLSAVSWTGMGDQHSWADKNNWSGGAVPGQSDDVTINAGSGTTINIASGQNESINSLVSNSPIADGGSLTVATTAQMSANVTVSGLLQGGTWTFSSGNVMNTSGAFTASIEGVTLNGNIDAATAISFFTAGNLTLNGTMSLGNTAGSTYAEMDVNGFLGGSGSIVFGESGLNFLKNVQLNTGMSSPGTLTIESPLVISGDNGSITIPAPSGGNTYGQIVNQGTIEDNVSGGTLTVSGSPFANQGLVEGTSSGTISFTQSPDNQAAGTMSANGGTISETSSQFSNEGSIQATNSGTLTISSLSNASGATVTVTNSTLTLEGSSLQNLGTITANNSTVNLAGEFSQAGLGTFNRTGGTVNVTGTVDGNITLNSTTGVWNILGSAVLNGTQITEQNGVDAGWAATGGILEGVTINGDLNLTLAANGYLYVLDSLTVTGNLMLGNSAGTTAATIYLGSPANFGTSQYSNTPSGYHVSTDTKLTVDGQIIFGTWYPNSIVNTNIKVIPKPGPGDPPAVATWDNAGVITYYGASEVEVAGAIVGGSGSITDEFSGGTIQIDTSVTASGSSSAIQVGGSPILGVSQNKLINDGVLQATGGASLTLGDLNQTTGTVTVSNSALQLINSLNNGSTITATNSTVYLGSTFTQAELGTFNPSGSIVYLTGTLTGGLTLNASTGSWYMHGGTVDGGVVSESGGAELAFTNFTGVLKDGVTFDGNMDLDAGLNASLQNSPEVKVDGGLTLNGTAYLGNAASSAFGSITFGDNLNSPGSLEGTGTVVFSGSNSGGNYIANDWNGQGGQTLTIGSGIAIQGSSGSLQNIGSSLDSIVLQGTVNANTAGDTIQLGNQGQFINQGALQATSGGVISGVGLVNSSGATIQLTGSTLSLSGNWINEGIISATNSTLNLAGTFTRATLGAFIRSGGTVNIQGTLSGGLNLNSANGSWTLAGGTIQGAAVNASGGSELILSNLGGTLAGVTINGNVDAATHQSAQATITGGLVLNGTITMGSASTSASLSFGKTGVAAGSLTGNGTILFNNTSGGGDEVFNNSNLSGSSGTFTIGPSITVSGNIGGFSSNFGGSIVNQGTIVAESSSGVITLGNSSGPFINQGTLEANSGGFRAGGVLDLDGQGTMSTNWAGNMTLAGNFIGDSTAYASNNPEGAIIFSGPSTANNPQLIETMSQDQGATAAGFQNNFVYGTIDIATPFAELVNQYSNAGGTDALYVNSIQVNSFDQLNLNGIHVYARAVQINGTVTGGTITQLPDGGAIQVNSPLPGSISPAGNQDSWTFFGHAGEAVTAYVNPGTGTAPAPIGSGLTYANIQLIEPNSTLLASGASGSGGGAVSLANISLPADGVYTIKIGAAASHPNNTGNYILGVWDVTLQNQPLLLGQNSNGTIDSPFAIQNWTFSALAGEQIQFHLNNETSAGLEYSLTGPNGFVGFTNLTGSSSLVNLTQTGAYTLSAQGVNGATGNYSFDMIPSTLTSVPLNGSVNETLAGSGQAELFSIVVPTAQALSVSLNDPASADSNELYLRFGSPPTRQTYDYRYSLASSPDQSILVPNAAAGTWFALVYAANVPAQSNITVSTVGAGLQVVHATPSTLGNSAPIEMEITGAGFLPGTTASLVSQSNQQYPAASVSVVSFAELLATFAAGLPAGLYSISVTQGILNQSLHNAFTITAGGTAHLQTGLNVPSTLGRHISSTIYVTYANVGTVAMAAPLLVLSSTDPNQKPLFTLDSSDISKGLWTSTLPDGYSNTIQILASGQIPGILLPGESITVPVYYAGLQQPWAPDFQIPLNLGVIDTADTTPVNWSSLQSSLQPPGVSNAAWNVIFSNLTQSLGNTWGAFVSALDANAAYLGGLGENVTDVNTLWGFMYSQADDSLGPVEHLQTVFDTSVPLPNGGSLSFWRNYHLAISGRYVSGILGTGWSVPYQSQLVVESSGDVELLTVGENPDVFQKDTRGGFFDDGDGNSLALTNFGQYTITAPDGESDTYGSNGLETYHADAEGDVINFAYNGQGQLISLTASTGQSITLGYNSAGLLGSLTTSQGNVITYNYDPTNQFLTSVDSVEGDVAYGYNMANDELTSIQNADGSYSDLSYDSFGRLLSLTSATASINFSYEQLGEISGTDAMNHVSHAYYDASGNMVKSVDNLGNPTYFTYDDSGNPITITNAVGQSFQYQYDSIGNLTRVTDPLGFATQMSYTSQGDLASYTDANGNETQLSYGSTGTLSAITYPDGTQEQFTTNSSGETTSLVQRNGQAINYTYDSSGDITQETFADGSHYNFTYDSFGDMLTATDSTGTTTFTYNTQGSLTSVTYPNNTSLTFTYNSLGQLTQEVDQSGYTLNYTYDAEGRPYQLLNGSNQPITTYGYNAGGEITSQTNANGTYTNYSYDANGNLLTVINYAPGGAINSEYQGTYNALNQLATLATPDGSWNYTYDSDGQLTRAIFTSTSMNVTNQDLAYSYDPDGNLSSTIIDGVTTNYSVNSMNEYTSIGGVTQEYDGDGNLLFDGTTAYTYNDLNQLTGFSNAQGSSQFTLNALGERVSSDVNGTITNFLNNPNGSGTPWAEYNSSGQLITHINQGLGPVSQTTAAGASYFYDSDLTGSIAGLTNSAGSYVDTYAYLPYGQSLASSGAVANPFQYQGDQMTQTDAPNLFGMGVREYSALDGRFMSTDPLQIAGGDTNLYMYAYNQPLQLADPSGLKSAVRWAYDTWAKYNGSPLAQLPGGVIDADPDGQGGFKTDTFPDEPPSDWESAKSAGGPFTETIEDGLSIIVYEQRLPTKDELLNSLEDHSFDALNKGPLAVFQVGTILKFLAQPENAINIGNGIMGIQRAHLCGTINGYEAAALVEIGMAPPGCENAPGVFAPVAPAGAGVTSNSSIATAMDPNDKFGPGFGASGFVAADADMSYRVDFENASTATAPAQQVVITDQLSTDDNWSTFRVAGIGWGDTAVVAPTNTQDYETTVPVTIGGNSFDVLVEIAISLGTGLVTAQFYSIDPSTGLPPGVLVGFLPPEDGTGRGMGYFSYTVMPVAGLPTGTQIRNVADVSFDEQPIIATDQVSDTDPTQGVDATKQALVTIDAGAPTSSVASLPATESSPSFTVSWSGQDDAGASGIASYSIYVSDNGGAFQPWLTDTAHASATYSGQYGHSYGFYSVSTDNVGNVQPTPAGAQATTQVVGLATWTGGGGDNVWSDADNWGGTAPAASSALAFAGNMRVTNTDDIAAGTQFSGIIFNAGAGAFVLGGNDLDLDGNIVNNSTTLQTVALPLTLVAGTTLDAASGNLALTGGIAQSSGSYAVTKSGAGIVTLSGLGSFTGGVTVLAGTLTIANPAALASGSSLIVGSNPAFALGTLTAAPAIVNSESTKLATSSSAALAAAPSGIARNSAVAADSSAAPVPAKAAVQPEVTPAVFGCSAMTASSAEMSAAAIRDEAIQAVSKRKYATYLPWFSESGSMSGSADQNDKRTPTVQALDAVMAEYGKT